MLKIFVPTELSRHKKRVNLKLVGQPVSLGTPR
jgi:hypothetical protein